MRFGHAAVFFALSLVSLTGCKNLTQFKTTGPEPLDIPGDAPRDGLRYYVARDLMVVDVDASFRRGRRWARVDASGSCVAESKPASEWLNTQAKVTVVTVPHHAAVYRLGIAPGSTIQQALNVSVSDVGLLTSLNYGVQDKTGDIISNVVRGAAGAAGFLTGHGLLGVRPSDEQCFINSGEHKAIDSALEVAGTEVEATRRDRLLILRQASRPLPRLELQNLRTRDSLLMQREAVLSQTTTTLRAARAASLARFVKKAGVAATDTVIRLQYIIDAATLPQELPGATFGAAKANLSGELKQLLDSARLALVLRELKQEGQAPPPGSGTGSIGCADKDPQDCARIFFRSPRQRSLEFYMPVDTSDTAALAIRERMVVTVVKATDPIHSIAFRSKRFADAGLKLGFGKYGNVTTLDQTSTSSLAGATASIANALSSARQEFAAGLKSAQEVQSTAQAIRQGRMAAQIKELSDQKALIEAELALRGTAATQDLVAERNRLNAELGLLQTQQLLSTTQADAVRATDLADVKDQIERLKLQIQLLQQQLELQKAQAALTPRSSP